VTVVGAGAAAGGAQLLPEVLAFSSSLPLDRQLLREDVVGSLAHLIMLARTGIVPPEAAEQIRAELVKAYAATELPEEEDVHMAVETLLTRALGETAGMLHTARSRNDQVALDLRLHVREQCAVALQEMSALLQDIAERADRERDTLLPGYTHRQRAQPVSAAYIFCAWGAMFARDALALAAALPREMPLGVGALAGTSLPIDRDLVRDLLHFPEVTENGLDTVGDRDFALDFAYAAARTLLHSSRVATDVIDFCTAEFGYVQLDDQIAMGSSMMPQKRNPDLFELIRGKTGRAVGNLNALLVTVKGLPGGYNRDLQEDRQPLLETGPLLTGVVKMLRLGLSKIRFDPERGRGARAAGARAGRARRWLDRGHRRRRGADAKWRALPHRLQADRRPGAPVPGGRDSALARAAASGAADRRPLHGGGARRRRRDRSGGPQAQRRRHRRAVDRQADRLVARLRAVGALTGGPGAAPGRSFRGAEGGAVVNPVHDAPKGTPPIAGEMSPSGDRGGPLAASETPCGSMASGARP
jgi:argininosuccinate lyase